MGDTYSGECKKCKLEGDLIEGICSSCNAGEYFCACGNEITEHELDTIGVCKDCK